MLDVIAHHPIAGDDQSAGPEDIPIQRPVGPICYGFYQRLIWILLDYPYFMIGEG